MSVATCPRISLSSPPERRFRQPAAGLRPPSLDAAPDLDLTHVEVVQHPTPDQRLGTYFDAATVAAIRGKAAAKDTIILILPAAHDSAACPLGPTTGLLTPLGTYRGTVPRMVAS
jgi:hypothetical protein